MYVLVSYRPNGEVYWRGSCEESWNSAFNIHCCETEEELIHCICTFIREQPERRCSNLIYDDITNIQTDIDDYNYDGIGENSVYCPSRYMDTDEEINRLEPIQRDLREKVRTKLGEMSLKARQEKEQQQKIEAEKVRLRVLKEQEEKDKKEYERLKVKFEKIQN